MTTAHQPHVFISYSRRDTALAETLEHDLNQRGILTWRDTHSIVGTQEWYESIMAGIQQCYVMLLIVTEHSEQSRWVKREALYADYMGKTILPIQPTAYKMRLFDFLLVGQNPYVCTPADYASSLTKLIVALEDLPKTSAVTPASAVRPSLTSADDLRRQELAYLDFLLSELEADLHSALYVSLLATPEKAARHDKLTHALPGKRRPNLGRLGIEAIPTEDFDRPGEPVPDARVPIHEMPRVVLLGEPGAGKTTTLLQLAIDMAHAAQTDPAAPLPVFVPLRSFNGDQPFADFVRAILGNLQHQAERLAGENRLLLLCDALNEMPRTSAAGVALLPQVKSHLETQARWVVSCRVRDYQEDLSGLPNVGKVRLQPLDLPRIHEILQKRFHDDPTRANSLWAELRGSDDLLAAWQFFVEAGQAEAFWGRERPESVESDRWRRTPGYYAWGKMQDDNRRMMPLCRNPYMLFLICEIYEATGKLPDNRGALFATFVDDLLEREETNCKATGAAWIGALVFREVLARLAFAMQQSETGTKITRREALTLIAQLHLELDSELLLRLGAAASLLQVGEAVRFTHQLLQEYFASEVMGGAMDRHASPAQFWPAENWWEPQGWEETAIILAGVRGDPPAVARWIAPAQPEVAYQALTRSGIPVNLAELDTSTQVALIDAAIAKKAATHPIARAAAFRVLGHLRADNRKGIGLRADGLPDFDWVHLLGGIFELGGDKGAWKSLQAMRVKVDGFAMTRYPVTWAQYQAFVDSFDGYQNKDWWSYSQEAAAWREQNPQPHDANWPIANHPRERVTWYESVAFCRWASAKLGYEIRLPTELEWERAARGSEKRLYAYGDDFDPTKANVGDTGIGQTSAVGIFPQGATPEGICDLSGNVCEWTLTDFGDIHNNNMKGDARRVVRGGAWYFVQQLSRSTSRYRDFPFNGYDSFGFRVLGHPPS